VDNVVDFNPIGDAGHTLVSILRDGMGGLEVSDQQIELVSPAQYDSDQVGLSLYLYHIGENDHLRNEPSEPPDPATEPGDPLVLELYFLLTVHPPDSDTAKTSDTMEQHRMLSEAMRTLRENAIISGPDLEGAASGDERLYVTISRQSPENVMDIWNSFQEVSHLPSVSYAVTPVIIDTESDGSAERVVESRFEEYTGTQGSQSGATR
jgi:hypothetical protein